MAALLIESTAEFDAISFSKYSEIRRHFQPPSRRFMTQSPAPHLTPTGRLMIYRCCFADINTLMRAHTTQSGIKFATHGKINIRR